MKKLKGILFDFNGTLFFDSNMHFEAFRRIMPKYGLPRPTDEFLIQNVFGTTNPYVYRKFINPNATDAECAVFDKEKIELYFDICLEMPEKFRLVPGVPEMLDRLKEQGIPYAIATGSNKTEMDFFIKHLGLERWFSWDNILYTDGSFNGKPAPDCYVLAAKKLGLDPSDCIVFEDGSSGIRAATAAGAGAIVAVFENGVPTPVVDGITVDSVHHGFTDWHTILSDYGIL